MVQKKLAIARMAFDFYARKFSSFVVTSAPVIVNDVLGLAGLTIFSYGAWLAWEPAGFLVGGLFCAILAFLRAANPANHQPRGPLDQLSVQEQRAIAQLAIGLNLNRVVIVDSVALRNAMLSEDRR